MTDELPMKTKTGGLDFHLAAAACYVPVMMINYVAPPVFLLNEPREHYPVRFHAAQSLLVSAAWIVGTVVTMFLSFVLPLFFIVLGSIVGMEDLFGMLGLLLQLVLTLVLMAVVFGGLIGLIALAVLTAMEKNPRVPVLAGLADRLIGGEPTAA
jgi:hypothetical protein